MTFRSQAEAASTGSTRKRISLRALRGLQLTLPAEVSEQQAIARMLHDSDDEIIVLRKRLDKAMLLKQGMMQELLSGRTRLKVKE